MSFLCRVKTKLDGNTLYLTITEATEADAGVFECVVNNGIGNEVRNATFLVVKRESLIIIQTLPLEITAFNCLFIFLLCQF